MYTIVFLNIYMKKKFSSVSVYKHTVNVEDYLMLVTTLNHIILYNTII